MAEGVFASPDDRRSYILQGAQQRGISPSLVDRLVRSEGGYAGYDLTGDHGQSFGPFQDYIGGGLGNTMLAQGLDPRNPANERAVINWNLDYIQKYGASPGTWHGLRNKNLQPEGYYGGATHINVEKDIPPEADNSLLLYAGILEALGGASGKEDTSKPALGTLQADTAGQPMPGATARTKPEQGDELLNAIKDRLDQTHPPNQLSGQPLPGIPSLQQASMPLPNSFSQEYGREGIMPPSVTTPEPPTPLPGTHDPYFWNPEGQAPYRAPGEQDDRMQMAGDITNIGPRALIPANQDPYADIMKGVLGPKRMVPTTPSSVQSPGLLDEGVSPANTDRIGPVGALYDGVLNALKQFNPIGSAQAGELPAKPPTPVTATPAAPQQPQQPAPAPQQGHGIENILSAIATGGLGAAGALGEDINNILGGLAQSLTPQGYLQQEERLMSGQMSPQELAGFVTSHIVGGAPPSSMSAGIRLPSRAQLSEASKGIQKIFSPTTVDPQSRAAETLFREATGTARRETSQAEAKVGTRGPLTNPPAASMGEAIKEPWRPLVAKHIPEFQQYLAAIKAGATPLQKPALLKFLDFVESRSGGATYAGPPELRDLADILRDIYDDRAAAIAAEPSTQWAGFVQDYFPHMWQEKAQAGSYGAGAGGQGSGRSLRQRSIPTISDGIAAGLTPVSFDPIDMTMRYVGNIDRYLAHNAIFRVARDGGMIKFFAPGKVPQGWMPLKGRLAERAVATGGQPGAIGMTAAAPEGFARVYNNAIGSGFFESEMGGPLYTALLRVKNGIVQTVLSLSGYHAYAMSQESIASGIANSIQALKRGDIVEAVKQLGMAPMVGVKSARETLGKGRRMERQYAGIEDYGPDYEKMADLWARGGGQGITRGREWQASEAHNFVTSFRRGMTMLELKAGLKHVGEGSNVVSQAGRLASFTATQIGRLMDTVTGPIFDTMIPRIKKAAFFDEMSEWLRQHPNASISEQVAQARSVIDTLDDRFGEMMMDNIFWGKRAKQTLQIAATSLGWELGSLRSIGGAPFDALRGKFDSPRVRYTIGLGTAIAIGNATYQYLMTGKTPGQDTGGLLSKGGALDLTLPRTGGQTPEGAYERAILPGFEKDILGYWKDPVGEFAGKLSPAGKLGVEAYTGRDSFTGRPIADFPKYTPDWFKAWGDHVLGAMRPIPTKQETYKGSAIPTWQRYMGARPAPEYMQNPERIDRIEYAMRMKNLQSEMRALVAHGSRTTTEPKYIQQRMKEIQEEMKDLTAGFQAQVKKDQGNRSLYFPPKRQPPGQVLQ